MMTLSKSNGLWTGSLQKHMAVSRRQMNKSYGLQQAQLARMNIVRDSQRLQLSAADTLVRLEQLKEEIKKNQYKSPPKVINLYSETVPYGNLYSETVPYGNLYDETVPKSIPNHLKANIGIIPNSNPALMNALIPYSDLNDKEEPLEEKRAPPTLEEQVAAAVSSRASSIRLPSSPGSVSSARSSPGSVSSARSSRASSIRLPSSPGSVSSARSSPSSVSSARSSSAKKAISSPTASQATTVDTSTTAQQGDNSSPTANEARFVQLKAQILKYAEEDPTFKDSFNYTSFAKSNPKKKEKVLKSIGYAENLLNNYESKKQSVGNGLGRMRKRGKGGRFISKR